MPRISVLLTSYNHEKFIAQAIDSVLAQTFADFELIIVDDCSSDSSWDVIMSYNDPRITAIRNEKRKGMHIFNNLHRFTGQYVAIHHSDDSWESTKLQKQIDNMDSHPETVACFTHVQFIDEQGENYVPHVDSFYHDKFDQPNRSRFGWLRFFFDHGNALCHPSILIRKEAFEKYGLFNFGLKQIPDFLMWIRVCLHGEIYVLQERLTKFRLHKQTENNTSGDNLGNHLRGLSEYYFVCEDLFCITRDDLFYKVFPEYSGQNIVPAFVLSKLMMQKNIQPAQLYGMRTIYKLLNDKDTAEQLKDLHNYTYIDFERDTMLYDPFSVKKTLMFLTSTLYINYGTRGFNEADMISKSVFVKQTGAFYVKYELIDKEDISGLRFDPDEGNLWEVALDSVIIDGVAVQATPLNSFKKSGDFDTFFTTDPIYTVSSPAKLRHVEISGRVKPLKDALESLNNIWALSRDRGCFGSAADSQSLDIYLLTKIFHTTRDLKALCNGKYLSKGRKNGLY